jgi:hypothetical protein
MGGKPGAEDAKGRLIYAHNGGRFMVSKPIDGKPATHANGGTIGFSMRDPKQVDAWHKAGVATGGTTIEDPPGVRQGPLASYISLSCAIPMATNCARFIACRLPELSRIKPERAVLSGRSSRAKNLARPNWPRSSRTLSSGSAAGAL